MKIKSFKVLLILVLVLSLSLVTLTPAMAQDEEAPILIVITSGFPFFGGQAVTGQGWEVGDEIKLYINDEYVGQTIAQPNAEGNASPIFDASGWGVIEPGDEVKIVRQSDGLTKEIIVTSFTSFVNAEDDKVYGTADRGANMVVIVPIAGETHYSQYDTAESNSYWSVDFDTYDITYGEFGSTGQYDDEYDMTAIFWEVTETSKLAPVSTIVNTYGGLNEAAEALQFDSVKELQEAIKDYYSGE